MQAEKKGDAERFADAHGSAMAKALRGAPVLMAPTPYGLRYEEERWPDVRFAEIKTYQARA